MAITRTPIIDDDGSGTTGTIINNAWKTELYNQIDALPSVAGVWTAYTPTWAGPDGIGPTLGNGLLSGRYVRIGHWVDVAIILKMGSTTVFGSSSYWYWTLPFAPVYVAGTTEVTFRGGAITGGGATVAPLVSYFIGTGVYLVTAAGAPVSPTVPFTWNANSILSIRGSYEV